MPAKMLLFEIILFWNTFCTYSHFCEVNFGKCAKLLIFTWCVHTYIIYMTPSTNVQLSWWFALVIWLSCCLAQCVCSMCLVVDSVYTIVDSVHLLTQLCIWLAQFSWWLWHLQLHVLNQAFFKHQVTIKQLIHKRDHLPNWRSRTDTLTS